MTLKCIEKKWEFLWNLELSFGESSANTHGDEKQTPKDRNIRGRKRGIK
jgi:hypothetical protein